MTPKPKRPTGKFQRRKGKRVELEFVNMHREIGVRADRVPLSGSANYQGGSHDIDVYAPRLLGPLRCEVKSRRGGGGFTKIERWLGDNDVLFLKRLRAPPLVVLPWSVWERLMK